MLVQGRKMLSFHVHCLVRGQDIGCKDMFLGRFSDFRAVVFLDF